MKSFTYFQNICLILLFSIEIWYNFKLSINWLINAKSVNRVDTLWCFIKVPLINFQKFFQPPNLGPPLINLGKFLFQQLQNIQKYTINRGVLTNFSVPELCWHRNKWISLGIDIENIISYLIFIHGFPNLPSPAYLDPTPFIRFLENFPTSLIFGSPVY